MEIYNLLKDITVLYVTAASFPQGIEQAQQQLHRLLPSPNNRNFYGLSRPENGNIVYKAAVEEAFGSEGQQLGCKTMIIKKGNYLSQVVKDYAKHIEQIAETFQVLLADPRIDHEDGYCVEQYDGADVRCMVILNSNIKPKI